ncbi:unnamed protein product [Rhizophagus irregularis]|nr:unnamed protein product [Rhizophagus irregularis]
MQLASFFRHDSLNTIPRMPITVQVTIVSAFTCSVIKLFLGIVLLLWSWISVLSIIEKCRVHLLLLPIESFWMLWTHVTC